LEPEQRHLEAEISPFLHFRLKLQLLLLLQKNETIKIELTS
jgi:hypothetical protein